MSPLCTPLSCPPPLPPACECSLSLSLSLPLKVHTVPNFSLSSVSPCALQPRWRTSGRHGPLESATGRACLSGCCCFLSLLSSALDYCSCRSAPPHHLPSSSSTANMGMYRNSRSELFHLLLLLFHGSLLSFSTGRPPTPHPSSPPLTLLAPSPSGLYRHTQGACSLGATGSRSARVTPAEPSRHHLALILVGPELRPSQ